jgi:hypothetical protein
LLDFYPDEPPSIASQEVRYTDFLKTLVTAMDLEGATSSIRDQVLDLLYELSLRLSRHEQIIP